MIDFNNIDFFESQRILIWGSPGSGKTLLNCYLGQQAMFQSFSNIADIYDEIDGLNSMGFHFSKNFEHTYFSTFDCNSIGTGIPDFRSYKFNPYYFGFAGDFKTIPYPPHSIFGIHEMQNYYPSTMNDYLRPEVLRKWQTSRHDGISIIGDVQRPTDVAKKIRDLFDYFVECKDLVHIICEGCCVGHIWTLRIIDNARVLEEYLRTNNKDLCTEIKFKVNRCLFYNYDSYSFKYMHTKGFENQDFEISYFGSGDEDILTAPAGYYIKRSDVVKQKNDDEDEVLF